VLKGSCETDLLTSSGKPNIGGSNKQSVCVMLESRGLDICFVKAKVGKYVAFSSSLKLLPDRASVYCKDVWVLNQQPMC
jgi:hypothetical protein